MNTLLREMRRTLVDLDKGLKGQLNMTQPMEDMIAAFMISEWPGRNPFAKCTWEKNAWPSMKTLGPQFNDLLRRVEQLTGWTADAVTPMSTWISGLFNPMAFLVAVQQVMARSTKQALDNTTIETHMTTFLDPTQITGDYPVDGMYMHGLFMEGARWTTPEEGAEEVYTEGHTPCRGFLMDSILKELLPPLPVMYVKAVVVLPHWIADGVGFLRNDPAIFECPVYINQKRGGTYVFLATMTNKDLISKWVMTATAVMMQTDS